MILSGKRTRASRRSIAVPCRLSELLLRRVFEPFAVTTQALAAPRSRASLARYAYHRTRGRLYQLSGLACARLP